MVLRRVQAVDAAGKSVIALLLVVGMAIFVSSVLVDGQRAGAQAATPGLTAAFGFNEGTGGTVSDASGNANTGLISGAAWTSQGKFGHALAFNGTNSHVSVPNSASVQSPSTALTVSAWIQPNGSPQAWSSVVHKVHAAKDVSYGFGQYAGNTRRFSGYLQVNGVGYTTAMSKALTNLTWYFVALTWQSGQKVTLTIYNANGSVFQTVTTTQAAAGTISYDASPLLIGEDEAGDHWKGTIDEVRIYNRALTASEIQSDLNTPIPPPPAPQPDTTPPTVSLTTPTDSAEVSGAITITANASDNVGVSGVQFRLNNVDLGTEDTTAPYSVVWDTTTAPVGANTLSAKVRDAAGNFAFAPDVTVYVSTAPNPQPVGLVAAYSFDEGSGSSAADTSGNNNTASIQGATWTTQGKYGNALTFTGNGWVTVNDANALDLSSGMTLEAWVYPTATPTAWSTALLKEQSGALIYALYAGSPSNRPGTYLFTSAEHGLDGPTALPINTWSHLAGTYDGTALRLYVNGTQVASQAVSGSIASSSGALRIGGNSVWGEYFQGRIDEVRIYNRPLSQADIQQDMNTPIPPPPPPAPPSEIGQWDGPFSWPVVTVHMTLLRTGEVLMWDGQSNGYDARLWNPITNTFTAVPSTDNIFCSGHAALGDGKILVVGGHAGGHTGIRDANIFDPATHSWTAATPMTYARWYPTATTLPDGRLLVTLGEINCDGCDADIPEIYNPTTNTWTRLTNARLALPYYPHMFILPDGRVLAASTSEGSIPSYVLDVQSQTWTIVDPMAVDGGSAAMYRLGKVLKSGKSTDPDQPSTASLASTYVLDMALPAPAWRPTAPMAFPRTFHTLTLLPDGHVLVTGGGRTTGAVDLAEAVFEAERWSPMTETWTTLASMQAPRLYHSTALLLPDGRVLVAGGGRLNDVSEPTDQVSAELYSPPYLFKGPRPTITSTPATIAYGTAFPLATPNASGIALVSLVRLGSVTHAFNFDQRFVELTFQPSNGGLNVQAPANANVTPPGYYMLFIVDTNGVPSVAAIVRVL
jgi:hypothetical protein